MTAFLSPFLSFTPPQSHLLSFGSSLKPTDQSLLSMSPSNVFSKTKHIGYNRSLTVQASGDHRRQDSTGIFISGFVLGGIVVGTLGCVYAPQISKALAGADRKDLMKKLPKLIYDEEKALEKTRKVLSKKIAQLNSAMDEVSAQLHPDDTPSGTSVNSDEIQAST